MKLIFENLTVLLKSKPVKKKKQQKIYLSLKQIKNIKLKSKYLKFNLYF